MSPKPFEIKTCPTCGSRSIKKVRANWKGKARGRAYMVPDLEYYECPQCGEKIYPPQALHRIQSYSPTYTQRRRLGA